MVERLNSSDVVVLLGTPNVESSRLYGLTVTEGDPAWAGPLAGVSLNLPVYHITEPEINRITSFLKRMAKPEYDDTVLEEPKETRAFDGGQRDEMFADAVRTVINEGKCSITLLQRRLQLGYARAARIVDMMEQEGVVSPGEGSKPRDVLVGPEFVDTLEAR